MSIFSPSGKSNGNGRSHAASDLKQWAEEKRMSMVESQLRRRGIRDERVLQAMGTVPRHEYVPVEHLVESYDDHAIAIGPGQTISQPYIVAAMTQALELKGTERVLEVGAGSGYQAAVMSALAAHVYAIEKDPQLYGLTRERLARLGLTAAITLLLGDGSLGYPPEAPYDGIVVAAAAPEVPSCYLEQLVEGGRLVIPVGDRDIQELRKIVKRDGKAVSLVLGHCQFVPLTGIYGWKPE